MNSEETPSKFLSDPSERFLRKNIEDKEEEQIGYQNYFKPDDMKEEENITEVKKKVSDSLGDEDLHKKN
jgi:hypothetical protein